jgi:hypothetical protein
VKKIGIIIKDATTRMPNDQDDHLGSMDAVASIFVPTEGTPAQITQRVFELAFDQLPRGGAVLSLYLGPNPSAWVIAGVMSAAVNCRVADVFVWLYDPERDSYDVINYI